MTMAALHGCPRCCRILGFEPLTWAKILPLGFMFFCILFNYTILRDTKDVLVVTAPGSGAEIIPFLKTWVNLPMAIGFTVLYAKVRGWRGRGGGGESTGGEAHCTQSAAFIPALPTPPSQLANVLSSEALFYTCIIPFIIFFGSFAGLLYPMRDVLHPTGACGRPPVMLHSRASRASMLAGLAARPHAHPRPPPPPRAQPSARTC